MVRTLLKAGFLLAVAAGAGFLGLVCADLKLGDAYTVVDEVRQGTLDRAEQHLARRAHEVYERERQRAVLGLQEATDAAVDAAAEALKRRLDEAAAEAKADLRDEIEDVGRLDERPPAAPGSTSAPPEAGPTTRKLEGAPAAPGTPDLSAPTMGAVSARR